MLKYLLICTTIVGSLGSNISAQDPAKKAGRGDPETAMVNQFLKQLEPAGLSQETTDKIKENFTKTAKEVMAKRKAVNLTPQMLKDRAEASKKAREDGKKPKEVREIALAAMKANEEQKRSSPKPKKCSPRPESKSEKCSPKSRWANCPSNSRRASRKHLRRKIPSRKPSKQ